MARKKKVEPIPTPDGTYRVRWTQGGKRRSQTFIKKVEAERFCRDLNRGIYPSLEKPSADEPSSREQNNKSVKTFSDLTKRYYKLHVEVNCTSSTKRNYRMYLDNHILPFFKDMELHLLHVTDLDNFVAKIKNTYRQKRAKDRNCLVVQKNQQGTRVKLSEKMQRELISLVLSIVKYGYERDYLASNPFKSFKLKKLKQKQMKYLTGEEVEKFISWCEAGGPYTSDKQSLGKSGKTITRYTANIEKDVKIFKFALHTGAREGEICGLKRKAIDFQNRLVWFSEIYDLSAKELAERTKGGNVRCIEFDSTVEELLRECESYKPEELVFDTISYPLWKEAFYVYCNRAGIKKIRFHDLRHTFATAMALHTPPAVLQKILGHQHISTTMKYVHIAQSESIGYTKHLKSIYRKHRDLEELASLTLNQAS